MIIDFIIIIQEVLMKNIEDEGMIIWNIQKLSGLNTMKFREKFLGESDDTSSQNWSNIKYGDYFTSTSLTKAQMAIDNKREWIGNAEKSFCYDTKENMIDKLIEILSKDNLQYAVKNLRGGKADGSSNAMKLYNEEEKDGLICNLQSIKNNVVDVSNYDLIEQIWCIMYFAIYKRLPASFAQKDKFRKDMEEYNDTVMKLYGNTTRPAYRAIIDLAYSGNIVAQNELADLFYYGRLSGGEPQHKKAFEWFKKAAGELDDLKAIHYPLACWNVAYMLFNYHFRRDLKTKVTIKEIEEMSVKARRENAINYCLLALEQDKKCIPAYNLLGVILDVLETITSESEEISALITKVQSSELLRGLVGTTINSEVLFLKASEGGYVEASSNLARRECDKALNSIENSFDEKEHVIKAIDFFRNAAEKNGTWACNKLGEFYRLGKISVYYEEIDKTETKYFPEFINEEKARYYYLKATDNFLDKDSAWASLHLLESFKDDLDNESLERCREVIELVDNKEVNELYRNLSKSVGDIKHS